MKRFQTRLLLLAGFLAVFPFFLRRRPRVERRMTIFAPPASIFPFLDELRNWPIWTEWNERQGSDYWYGDQTAGAGATQWWHNAWLSGEMRIVRSDLDERLDYELAMNGCAPIFGRILLQQDGACTRVIWRCVWERAENPYRRYLDLIFQRLIGRDFQASLERLKSIVESA